MKFSETQIRNYDKIINFYPSFDVIIMTVYLTFLNYLVIDDEGWYFMRQKLAPI